MKKIEPIKLKIRKSGDSGIFHDSRADIRNLAQLMNVMIEKQNEVIQAVNRLIDLQDK